MAPFNVIETQVHPRQVESLVHLKRGETKIIVNNPMLFNLTVFCRRHEDWGTHTIGGSLDFSLNGHQCSALSIATLLDAYRDEVLRGIRKGLFIDGFPSTFLAGEYLDLRCGRRLIAETGKIIYQTNEYAIHRETSPKKRVVELISYETVLCVKALTAGAWYFAQLHRNPAYLKVDDAPPDVNANEGDIDSLVGSFIDQKVTLTVRNVRQGALRSVDRGGNATTRAFDSEL